VTSDDKRFTRLHWVLGCSHERWIIGMGGATILKVGIQVRERSERKIYFDPLTFGLPGGGRHKTGLYSFHYCNYNV